MRMTFRIMVAWIAALILPGLAFQSPAFAQKGQKISLKDAPSLKEGSPEIVLVEIADFECSYCGMGAREVLPLVHEKFVRTGKVELVFLHLPLDMHPHAFKAAEAAACAGDQGKFWDMHHLLFAKQNALAEDQLAGYAKELGLNAEAFQACFSKGRMAPGIRDDVRTANLLGISSTPFYLIARRAPGGDKARILEAIKGLPPYEYMEEKLNAALAVK